MMLHGFNILSFWSTSHLYPSYHSISFSITAFNNAAPVGSATTADDGDGDGDGDGDVDESDDASAGADEDGGAG